MGDKTGLSESYTVTIDDYNRAGEGVARCDDGKVVFVPGAVRGERVVVDVHAERKSFRTGRLDDVLAPSRHRVEPICHHFRVDACGGCTWQHLDISEQRWAKTEAVARALRHVECEIAPLGGAPKLFGWRRRARVHYESGDDGIRLGFHAIGSRDVVGIRECPQLESRLFEVISAIGDSGCLHGRGQVLALAGGDPDEVHVVVDGPHDQSVLMAAASEHRFSIAAEGIELDQEGGLGRHRAMDFVQANRDVNRLIVDSVAELVGDVSGLRVVEFFAGAGNLTQVFTGAAHVHCIDNVAPLRRPAAATEYSCGDAVAVCRRIVKAGARADVVVLDPPRVGAKALVRLLPGLEPDKIVYVSCDLATLARDLTIIQESGFRCERVIPFDMMPQTPHVEVVVSLKRAL